MEKNRSKGKGKERERVTLRPEDSFNEEVNTAPQSNANSWAFAPSTQQRRVGYADSLDYWSTNERRGPRGGTTSSRYLELSESPYRSSSSSIPSEDKKPFATTSEYYILYGDDERFLDSESKIDALRQLYQLYVSQRSETRGDLPLTFAAFVSALAARGYPRSPAELESIISTLSGPLPYQTLDKVDRVFGEDVRKELFPNDDDEGDDEGDDEDMDPSPMRPMTIRPIAPSGGTLWNASLRRPMPSVSSSTRHPLRPPTTYVPSRSRLESEYGPGLYETRATAPRKKTITISLDNLVELLNNTGSVFDEDTIRYVLQPFESY